MAVSIFSTALLIQNIVSAYSPEDSNKAEIYQTSAKDFKDNSALPTGSKNNSPLVKLNGLSALDYSANSAGRRFWTANNYVTGWFSDPPVAGTTQPESSSTTNFSSISPLTATSAISITPVTLTNSPGASGFRLNNVNSTSFAAAFTANEYISATITLRSTSPVVHLSLLRFQARNENNNTAFGTIVLYDVTAGTSTQVTNSFALAPAPNGVSNGARVVSSQIATPLLQPGRTYELRTYFHNTAGTTTNYYDNPEFWIQINEAPTAANDSFTSAQGAAANISVLSNDTDPENDTLTVTQINGTNIAVGGTVAVTGGTVKLNANGTLTYTPTAGYSGSPSFTYTISDGNNNTATATVSGTVTLTPDLTIAKSHSGSFTVGSTGTYTLQVNNIGATSTSGTITVTDTLPTGLTVNGGAAGAVTLGGTQAANWTCNSNAASPQVITCMSSTAITASGSSVFNFTVNVGANTPIGTNIITNTATVSGGGETNTANDSSSDPTTVNAQPNFGSCDARIYLSQGSAGVNTTLYNVDYSANPFTFPPIGTGSTVYNAAGYNPADNYIYALDNSASFTNNLLRIGSDGNTVNLGAVSGLPTGAGLATGEIGADGVFYVKSNSSVSTFYAVNLTTLTATTKTMSASFNTVDWAWSNGLLYSVDTTGVVRSINPSSGVVTVLGNSGITGGIGAMWGTPTGIYGNQNGGAGFYKFDTVNGSATKISNSPGATSNDAAHCVNAGLTFPSDLAITKTDGQTNYVAGTNNVYTITATNNGPFGAQNVTVSDPLPTGITTASWTCAVTGGGVCAASGTGAINDTVDLPVGAVATYTMTMTVPAGFTGNLVNTATATVSASNTDSTPGNNSATDLAYQIAFTNTDGIGAVNMIIVDGVPANTDYKLGSATVSPGTTGLTMVIEYSNDYDPLNPTLATWVYTPVSAGGGAAAGYDRLVKAVRWRVTAGTLSNVSPNNTGNVSFIAKIR